MRWGVHGTYNRNLYDLNDNTNWLTISIQAHAGFSELGPLSFNKIN